MKAAKKSGVITSWLAFSANDPAFHTINPQLLNLQDFAGLWVRKNSASAITLALYGVNFMGTYNSKDAK
jgi:hypothetical protein